MIVATGTLIPLGIVAAARIPFSSETLRKRLVHTLEDRLDADVELSALTLRFHPRLRAVGTGLTIRARNRSDIPPLIQVAHFTVDAELAGLWHRHVSNVRVDGLQIRTPPDDPHAEPSDVTAALSRSEPSSETVPSDYLKQVVIDDLDAPDAELIVLRSDPTKQPRKWSLHQLHLKQVSFSTPQLATDH